MKLLFILIGFLAILSNAKHLKSSKSIKPFVALYALPRNAQTQYVTEYISLIFYDTNECDTAVTDVIVSANTCGFFPLEGQSENQTIKATCDGTTFSFDLYKLLDNETISGGCTTDNIYANSTGLLNVCSEVSDGTVDPLLYVKVLCTMNSNSQSLIYSLLLVFTLFLFTLFQ